jgi:hypothetical protein
MRKLIFTSLMILGTNSFAQNLVFYGFLPAWNQTGRISKRVNYNLFTSTTIDAFRQKTNDIVYPASDFQLYIQPSLIFVQNASLNFSASYTFQRNNPFTKIGNNEHRFWQQAVFAHSLKPGRMTHRIRFEERIIQNLALKKYLFSTRVRYQIAFNLPLQGKTLDPKEFYLNMYNELYLSLTGPKNTTYSENWTYAGVGYNTTKIGRIELGYLHQELIRNLAQNIRYLNLLQVQWITNFEFRHRKSKK